MATLRLGRTCLRTGIEVEWAESGSGPPILCLHGFTDSRISFEPLMVVMPEDVRVLAPSQRGHGDSDRPADGYTIPQLAEDAAAFLDALSIERAAVVGHSMGSFVAQALALAHPGRVERLVLVGSAPGASMTAAPELERVIRSFEDPIDRAFVEEFQRGSSWLQPPAAFERRVVDESMKLPARVWRAMVEGLVAWDASEELDRLAMPLLLIHGDRDEAFDGFALARRLPAARARCYAETGHTPHWERPERVAADLLAFLRDTASVSAHP